MTLMEMLIESPRVQNKTVARRLVLQGAISIDRQIIYDLCELNREIDTESIRIGDYDLDDSGFTPGSPGDS